MYSMKEVTVCDGKKIHIFDNLFTLSEIEKFYEFIRSSMFLIDGGDGFISLYNDQIYSSYSDNDIINMGFYKTKGYEIINKFLNISEREKKQIRVNCSIPSEKMDVHQDGEGITLLYYANLKWELNWGGHTLFLNENLSDIEYTCAYKMGRVVVFDGTIPHLIMLANHQAIGNRLSFVIQYK